MIQRGFNLQQYNTLALHSTAEAYIKIIDLDSLTSAINYCAGQQLAILPLGEGSNIVLQEHLSLCVLDVAIPGITAIKENASSIWVEVGAGENWHQWVMHSIAHGWYGLENLALIPGRVGAAPIQNIGAYGCEVESAIDSVNYINIDEAISGTTGGSLNVLSLAAEQCQFHYRDSIFKQSLASKVVITSVVFKLSKRFKPQLDYPALNERLTLLLKTRTTKKIDAALVAEAIIAIRSEKLPNPAVLPNAGSFFKNVEVDQATLTQFLQDHPEAPYFPFLTKMKGTAGNKYYKIPAAWLIDQCGFKGRQHGSFMVHKQQALVLVNVAGAHAVGASAVETSAIETNAADKARATDLIDFADKIASAVKQRFGFTLIMEPQLIPPRDSINNNF